MVWFDMVWYGMVLYGTVWCSGDVLMRECHELDESTHCMAVRLVYVSACFTFRKCIVFSVYHAMN